MNEDKKTLESMLEGNLPWDQLKLIIGYQKDPNRFDAIMEILQENVKFKEQILLPLHEHLFIVSKNGERIVKCDCGFEFGDFKIKSNCFNNLSKKYFNIINHWLKVFWEVSI